MGYRSIKAGGYLVVTHSNALFDMFSLNRYTVEFFKTHFVADPHYQEKLAALLAYGDRPQSLTTFNVRENPLSYRYKLAAYGFEETRQEFSNLHIAPPPIMPAEKEYPDTLEWPDSDRWKLMFTCSTYGSCSRRVGA